MVCSLSRLLCEASRDLKPNTFLFVYDGLMNRLHQSGVGCSVNDVYFGVLAYADYITWLASKADAMKTMLQICNEYATKCSISFNVKK